MPHSLIFTGTLLIYIKYIMLHRVFSQGEFWQSVLLGLLVVFQNIYLNLFTAICQLPGELRFVRKMYFRLDDIDVFENHTH